MEKIWLSQYQNGVPAEINPDKYQSIIEVFEEGCQKYADKIAYSNLDHSITYREAAKKVDAFASFLQNELGIQKGDRVAIMLPNTFQYPITMFAVLKVGGIVVNFNPLYTADEVAHQLVDSGAKAIVVMANFASVVQEALPKTQPLKVIVTEMGDLFPFVKRHVINFVLKKIKKLVLPWNIPGAIRYRKALALGLKKKFKPVVITNEDLAYLQYTGGTTGIAKGAMLTHRNMVANIEQVAVWMQQDLAKIENLIIVTALPLYHIFSLTVNCLVFWQAGAHNVLITNPRDIPGFIKELSKYPFTFMVGVNTLFNALLNNSNFAKLDFSNLLLVLGGGMAMQSAVAERWERVTKKPLIQGYGLTEASPVVSISPLYLTTYKDTIGLPAPSTDIKICNEQGEEVSLGEPGELLVKGPQVMKGYWQRPDETANVITPDGWLKTGDIATVDHEGYIRIVDRAKDLVIVSGFNVYPTEIEEVIAAHPGVQEVAVIGVPSNVSGESVKAFIVRKDPNLTRADIMAYCREHLTGYKIPRLVEFRDELPKSNVGKILRRALRQEELQKAKSK